MESERHNAQKIFAPIVIGLSTFRSGFAGLGGEKMSTCNIALVGAAGRMGIAIVRAAQEVEAIDIGAAVDHPDCPAIGRDIGELAGIGSIGVLVDSAFKQAFERADVVVDLSLPEATGTVVETARLTQKPLVCGTTGLDTATLELFDAAAIEIPVLYTSNLSPGVAVMTALVRQAVPLPK